MRKLFASFLIVLGIWQPALAQTTTAESALLLPGKQMSSVGTAVDISMASDSISYLADDMFYDVLSSTANLFGDVQITSGNSILRSDTITIDLKRNIMTSHGTTYIKDKANCMIGYDVWVNPKKEWTLFLQGSGKLEVGYYYGSQIRQVKNGVYDIDNGMFTTCDSPEHHWDIYSTQMRIYRGQMVVMKPVIILVNHFPIFALPSYSFSIARGKQNGFLMPKPGRNSNDGKFLENIGYYLFFSDYWDGVVRMNIRENTGLDGEFITRYKKRYSYEGCLEINQSKVLDDAGRSSTYEGEYHYDHSQNFLNGSKLTVDANYYSSLELVEDEEDIDTRTDDEIESEFSYSWPLLSSTLNISGSYVQDMGEQTKSITLPSASYSLTSRPVWELFQDVKPQEDPWWEDFSYSASAKAIHNGSITNNSSDLAKIIFASQKDSSGAVVVEHEAGTYGAVNLAYSRKFWGWLTFSQSLPTSFAYSSQEINYTDFETSYKYSLSNSLGFDIIGFRNFGNFFLKGVRHTIGTSVSFNYVPEIENDATGPYAISATSESRTSKINLSSVWDLKLNPPGKTDKLLLNSILTASTAYTVYDNDEDEEGKWDDITWSAKLDGQKLIPVNTMVNAALKWTHLSNWFSYSLSNSNTASATQNPYNFELEEWEYEVPLKNSMGFKLSHKQKVRYFNYSPAKYNMFEMNKFFNNGQVAKRKNYIVQENSIGTSISYKHNIVGSQTKGEGYHKEEDYSLDLTSSAQIFLSKTWVLKYSNSYDIKEEDMGSQTFSAVKHLHCWDFSFSYTKEGAYWEYEFSFFNVKLPSDLKYEDDADSNDD